MSAALCPSSTFAPVIRPFFTAGGLLLREGEDGLEICLARANDGWRIPRGRVLEDERVADAAVRRVYEITGVGGSRAQRIRRVVFGDGEIAQLFLIRARRSDPHDPARALWVPLTGAALLLPETERHLVSRVARLYRAVRRPARARRERISAPARLRGRAFGA